MTLNVALIGCGRIAGHHCRSIQKVNGVRLIAVCDLEIDKASAYAEKFDVPAYTNYRVMFDRHPDIDIAAVITPSGMHFEHTTDIISTFGKHVIVEKPTFMQPGQMVNAYNIAKTHGTDIFPVFQNRYNKSVCRVRDALNNDELGDIRIISVRVRWCRPQRYYDMASWRGTFSHDGGALTNQSIHHVDLMRHLGGEVDTVNATMRTLGANIEVEDTCVATFKYKNGAVGVLEATTAARPDDFEASLSIVGSKGLAQIGGIAVNELQIFTPDPDACATNSEDFSRVKGHGAVYGFGHTQMYQDIVDHFNAAKPYPVVSDDCLQTLKLLNAFYRSDEQKSEVSVDSTDQSLRLGRENDSISNLYRTPIQ